MNFINSVINSPELAESKEYLDEALAKAVIPDNALDRIKGAIAIAFFLGAEQARAGLAARSESLQAELDHVKKHSMPPGFDLPVEHLYTEMFGDGNIGVRMTCGDPENCGCDTDPLFVLSMKDALPFASLIMEAVQNENFDRLGTGEPVRIERS